MLTSKRKWKKGDLLDLFSASMHFLWKSILKKAQVIDYKKHLSWQFLKCCITAMSKIVNKKAKSWCSNSNLLFTQHFFCKSLLNKILPEGLNHAHSWENNFLPWIFALEKWQYENNFEHLSCLVLQVKMNTTLTFK